jgi:hypothetical protein
MSEVVGVGILSVWAQRKNEIALKLGAGQCGGSYGDAVIIFCAVLSALAAEVWPGRGIDRVRFVELLKSFAPQCFDATRISIPLLVEYLRTNGRGVESEKIRRRFLNYYPTRILTGDDVDKSETEILEVCQTLSLKELREHSYANLLYSEIRCPYAHEYRPGQRADSSSMTGRDAIVSYLNVDDPDQHIHFHLRGTSELTLGVAQAVDAIADSLPRSTPQQWWVYGPTKCNP